MQLLRRMTVLTAMVASLCAGLCRQACALDAGAAPERSPASACTHCRGRAERAPARPSRAPCCARGVNASSALIPSRAALPAVARVFAAVLVDRAVDAYSASAPVALASRAPPGAAPLVLGGAPRAPRPPPSLLAVL